MPKLGAAEEMTTGQGYGYTGVTVDKLEASEFTLVSIVVDQTGSVSPFKDDLERMIVVSLDSCQKSPRALNLIARVTAFNDGGVQELLGFMPLGSIDTAQFMGSLRPIGGTPLFDATEEGIAAIDHYADQLYGKQISSNGIIFIITDGDDNASRSANEASIKDLLSQIQQKEHLESIRTILIGVNETDAHMKTRLEAFKTNSNLDEYISMGDATKGKLAKLAKFVSQSVSSQSQALGTGGPSKPIDFTF